MVESVNNSTNLLRAQSTSSAGLKTTQRVVKATIDDLRKPTTVSVTSTPLASTSSVGKNALPRGSLVDISV